MFATLHRYDGGRPVKVNPRHVLTFEPLPQNEHYALVGTRLVLIHPGETLVVSETLTEVERALAGRVA